MGNDDDGLGPAARPLPQPIEWLFRDRVNGGITVAEFPNLALIVFIVAVVTRRLVDPTSAAGTASDIVADAALVWWSIDEIARGVNPWRRLLGAVVLAFWAIGAASG